MTISVRSFSQCTLAAGIGRLAFPLLHGVLPWVICAPVTQIYAIRLLAAGDHQLPIVCCLNNHLNICFTLLAGLLALKVLDSRNQWIRVFGLISIMALVHIFDFEYGNYGCLPYLFYYYRDNGNLPLYQGILTFGILVYRCI